MYFLQDREFPTILNLEQGLVTFLSLRLTLRLLTLSLESLTYDFNVSSFKIDVSTFLKGCRSCYVLNLSKRPKVLGSISILVSRSTLQSSIERSCEEIDFSFSQASDRCTSNPGSESLKTVSYLVKGVLPDLYNFVTELFIGKPSHANTKLQIYPLSPSSQ